MSKFLQVNKDYFEDETLTLIEMCILSQVDEFIRNNKDCYMTDEQFAKQFHVSVPTIQRALGKLEQKKLLKRNTITTSDNGQATRFRTITSYKASKQASTTTKKSVAKSEVPTKTFSGYSF